MLHVGERLREARLAQGVSLSDIADKTRISLRYLQALEKGDWKQLPGAIFARSFARQYAACIGYDIAALEGELQERFANEDPVQKQAAKQPPAERIPIRMRPMSELIGAFESRVWQRMPKPFLSFAAVLALCSFVYVGWERVILNRKQTTVDILAGSPLTKLPVDPSAQPRQQQAKSVEAPAKGASAPAAATALATGGTVVTTAASSTSLSGETSAIELQVPPGAGNNTAVRIVASQETWVSITANGKTLFSGTLQPSEVRLMRGVSTARMVIGNAGGVLVETDGRSLGPIGPQGQVRVLLITPEGPKVVRTQDLVKAEPPPPPSQTD